jgi:hypothetical protein
MKTPKGNTKFFECKSCDFTCSKQSNYQKHLLTSKHKQLTNIENVNKNTKIFVCDLCSKQYFSRVGLWKHDKVCTKKPNNEVHDHDHEDEADPQVHENEIIETTTTITTTTTTTKITKVNNIRNPI